MFQSWDSLPPLYKRPAPSLCVLAYSPYPAFIITKSGAEYSVKMNALKIDK